jgi:CheY-like chemotaxis protein
MSSYILALTEDNGTKTSLGQVLRDVSPNILAKFFKSPADLTKELKSSSDLSLVLIDYTEDIMALTSIMSVIREKSSKDKIKVVIILDSEVATDANISKYLSIGFSGFLLKPFSQKSILEVLKISDQLSKKGSFARLKVATSLNVKSFLDKQNRVIEGSSILKAVKNACRIFETENDEFTVNGAAEELAALSPKERLEKKALDLYKIFSRSARKKLEETP